MNIIKDLTRRMIADRGANKAFACKNYATEEAAEKATAAAAKDVGDYFDNDKVSARYVVFYVAEWQRWVGAIELSEVLRRPNSRGGYLGIQPGFYKF